MAQYNRTTLTLVPHKPISEDNYHLSNNHEINEDEREQVVGDLGKDEMLEIANLLNKINNKNLWYLFVGIVLGFIMGSLIGYFYFLSGVVV